MLKGRSVFLVLLVISVAGGMYWGYSAYTSYRSDQQEEVRMATFRSDWNFNPNDPNLLEVRLLKTDGYAVSLGFPTIVERDGEQFLDFVSASATFLDLGAQQIHMASNPDATLADIPLGSTVKVRVGADGDNPGSYYIYDIYVLQ
jgi:hypothetical protein